MKRLLAFLFTLLYVSSVSGATLNAHFCGGTLQKISIAGLGHEGCCCGSKKMSSNCCKDVHIVIKVKGEHKSIAATAIPVSIPQNIPVVLPSVLVIENYFFIALQTPNFHSPPIRGGDIDLLILNSTFRI